jgi:peptidoglycan/LPS O-acetylase OafA/YrhL
VKSKTVGFVMLLLGGVIVLLSQLSIAYQWEVHLPSKLVILGYLSFLVGSLLMSCEPWSLKKAARGSVVLGLVCLVAGIQSHDGGLLLLFGSFALVTSVALFYHLGVERT